MRKYVTLEGRSTSSKSQASSHTKPTTNKFLIRHKITDVHVESS